MLEDLGKYIPCMKSQEEMLMKTVETSVSFFFIVEHSVSTFVCAYYPFMIYKWEFFQIVNHVSTTVWLHHLNFNETPGEVARWKLHKTAACWTATYLLSHKPPK